MATAADHPPSWTQLSKLFSKIIGLESLQTNYQMKYDYKQLCGTTWVAPKNQKRFKIVYEKCSPLEIIGRDYRNKEQAQTYAYTANNIDITQIPEAIKNQALNIVETELISLHEFMGLLESHGHIYDTALKRFIVDNYTGERQAENMLILARMKIYQQEAEDEQEFLNALCYGLTNIITVKEQQIKIMICLLHFRLKFRWNGNKKLQDKINHSKEILVSTNLQEPETIFHFLARITKVNTELINKIHNFQDRKYSEKFSRKVGLKSGFTSW